MKAIYFLLAALSILALSLVGCEVNSAERNNAGNVLYDQQNFQDAVEVYQAAQVAAPDAPEPYYNAASALANTGRLQSAVAALQQALKTADDDLTAKAYYNLGNIYFDMAQYDEATRAYQEVLLRSPDDADARHNYELALLRRATPTPPPSDSETDPQATPTEDPNGEDGLTPTAQAGTPTPQNETGEGDENQETPTPQPEGSISVEDAERILDAVQQNQRTLQEYLQRQVDSSKPLPDEDW